VFSHNAEQDLLLSWCQGNKQAMAYLKTLGQISQIADDFVDGDTTSSDKMTQMLKMALVDLPMNPFFAANSTSLCPLHLMAMVQWNGSNEWAKSEDESVQMFGYVYREAMEQIVPVVSEMCGGDAIKVAKEINAFYHQQHGETFNDWKING
jgi:hypothetical protein